MFSLDSTFRFWLYNRPVDMRKSFNGLSGIVNNDMLERLRSGDTARRLIGGYRSAVQTDGYEVYNLFEDSPGKRMIGCWAHARLKNYLFAGNHDAAIRAAIIYSLFSSSHPCILADG